MKLVQYQRESVSGVLSAMLSPCEELPLLRESASTSNGEDEARCCIKLATITSMLPFGECLEKI
jgi:hypothetical protein